MGQFNNGDYLLIPASKIINCDYKTSYRDIIDTTMKIEIQGYWDTISREDIILLFKHEIDTVSSKENTEYTNSIINSLYSEIIELKETIQDLQVETERNELFLKLQGGTNDG